MSAVLAACGGNTGSFSQNKPVTQAFQSTPPDGPGSGGSINDPAIATLSCGFADQSKQLSTAGFNAGSAFVFSWKPGYSAPAGVGLTNSGVLTLPATVAPGNYTLQIRVTASKNGIAVTSDRDIPVTVEGNCGPGSGGSINDPAIGTLSCGFADQSKQLSTAGFNTGSTFIFSWKPGYSAPAGVGLTNAGILTIPATTTPGTYTLQIRVTASKNGASITADRDVVVSIPDCAGPGGTFTLGTPPTLSCPVIYPQNIAVTPHSMGTGTAYSMIYLKKNGTNYNGSEFALDSASAPTQIVINASPASGTYTFSVRASRNSSTVDSAQISITVPDCDGITAVNTSVSAISNSCPSTTLSDITYTTTPAQEPAGTTYSVVAIPPTSQQWVDQKLTVNGTSKVFNVKSGETLSPGTYFVQIRANNPSGYAPTAVYSNTITITINDCGPTGDFTIGNYVSYVSCSTNIPVSIPVTSVPSGSGTTYDLTDFKKDFIAWDPPTPNPIQVVFTNGVPTSITIAARLDSATYDFKLRATRNSIAKTAPFTITFKDCACSYNDQTYPQGSTATRVKYKDPSVPYGKQCAPETQTGTCFNAAFTWAPQNYSNDFCVVQPPFCGGSGTPSDPYQICDAPSLSNIRDFHNKYFIQIADIDFTQPSVPGQPLDFDCDAATTSIPMFLPISNRTLNYDGQGYTISNLCYDNRLDPSSPVPNYIGLFQSIANNSTIRNLNLININYQIFPDSNSTAVWNVGGLVGYKQFSSQLKNIKVTGKIEGNPNTSAYIWAGGIASIADSYVETAPEKALQDLTSEVNINLNKNGTVCRRTARYPQGGIQYNAEAGGAFHQVGAAPLGLQTTLQNVVVGKAGLPVSIDSCASSGLVTYAQLANFETATVHANLNSSGMTTYGWSTCADASGGIVGTAFESSLRNAKFTGSLSAPQLECTGGIAGLLSNLNRPNMILATSSVTATGAGISGGIYTGGLIGQMSSTAVTQSYFNSGFIKLNTHPAYTGFLGGLFGMSRGGSILSSAMKDGTLTLDRTKNNGNLSFNMGGIVGFSTSPIEKTYAHPVNVVYAVPVQNSFFGGIAGSQLGATLAENHFNPQGNSPITVLTYVGGLIGNNSGAFDPNRLSYWNAQTSAIAQGVSAYSLPQYRCDAQNPATCRGLDTPGMNIPGNFQNWWGLGTVWQMLGGYPQHLP